MTFKEERIAWNKGLKGFSSLINIILKGG